MRVSGHDVNDTLSATDSQNGPLWSIFSGQTTRKRVSYNQLPTAVALFGPRCCLCASVFVRMKPVFFVGNGKGNYRVTRRDASRYPHLQG